MIHPFNVNSHFKTTWSRNISYYKRQHKKFAKCHAEFMLFTEKVILKFSKHQKVFNLTINIGDIKITRYCFFNCHTNSGNSFMKNTIHQYMPTHTYKSLKESQADNNSG